MTKVDSNNEYVSLGTDENGNPIELRVDPITGFLLVDVTVAVEASRTLKPAKIDENHESASLVTGTDGEIYPLQIDSRNDGLLIDFE
jgi:hypothetical protein